MALVRRCMSDPKACALVRLVPGAPAEPLDGRIGAHASQINVTRPKGSDAIVRVSFNHLVGSFTWTWIFRIAPAGNAEELRFVAGDVPTMITHRDRVDLLLTSRLGPALLIPVSWTDRSPPQRISLRSEAPLQRCPHDPARLTLGTVVGRDVEAILVGVPDELDGETTEPVSHWRMELGLFEGRACSLGITGRQQGKGAWLGTFRWDEDGALVGSLHRERERIDYQCKLQVQP